MTLGEEGLRVWWSNEAVRRADLAAFTGEKDDLDSPEKNKSEDENNEEKDEKNDDEDETDGDEK